MPAAPEMTSERLLEGVRRIAFMLQVADEAAKKKPRPLLQLVHEVK